MISAKFDLRLVVCLLAAAAGCTRPIHGTTPTTPTTATAQRSADGVWQFVAEHPRPSGQANPAGAFAIARFDRPAFQKVIAGAPLESSGGAAGGVVVSLPMPDQTFARVRVVESPMLAPELAAAFPDIKTYVGQGIDDPTITVRFGWTQNGFHALMLGPSADVYIDPYVAGDLEYCITMRKAK